MTDPILEVSDLKKSYGKLDVLNGIDFELQKGEVVCVIGPSGSGKSTLLRCLNMLEEPGRRQDRSERNRGLRRKVSRRTSTCSGARSGWSSSRSTSSPT